MYIHFLISNSSKAQAKAVRNFCLIQKRSLLPRLVCRLILTENVTLIVDGLSLRSPHGELWGWNVKMTVKNGCCLISVASLLLAKRCFAVLIVTGGWYDRIGEYRVESNWGYKFEFGSNRTSHVWFDSIDAKNEYSLWFEFNVIMPCVASDPRPRLSPTPALCSVCCTASKMLDESSTTLLKVDIFESDRNRGIWGGCCRDDM